MSTTAGQQAPIRYLALEQQGVRWVAGLGRRQHDSFLKIASLSSCRGGSGRLLLAVRGHTRARTTAERRQSRAARPPRRHCAASRSTSACPGAVRGIYVSSQLAKRREKGSALGHCRGTIDAVIASRRRHGARRFMNTVFLSPWCGGTGSVLRVCRCGDALSTKATRPRELARRFFDPSRLVVTTSQPA